MAAIPTSLQADGLSPEALRLHPGRFLNRELSWIAFNERVLQEANSPRHPLLERLRFLGISHTNLVEFYNVRVAGLIAQERVGVKTLSQDGLLPTEQLQAIRARTGTLIHQQQQTWINLRFELHKAGICITLPESLSTERKAVLEAYFQEAILPLLTPIAIDPAHPFPFIPNRGVALALELIRQPSQSKLIALLPIPKDIPRFIAVPDAPQNYLLLEDIIILFLNRLYPEHTLEGHGLFQVLRDSEIEIDDEAEDLVRHMETALKRRRRGIPIQLMMDSSMPESLRTVISIAMNLDDDDIFAVDGLVNLGDVAQLVALDEPELSFTPFQPRFPERIRDFNGDCFAAIRHKDIVVHHPYESFDVVVQFLRQAAHDPDVLVIKQTLYRTSKESPIVQALIQAAENGKSVTAVVELKARFDEEANLQWARDMERAGVHVVFGFVQYKTHAKVSLVIRREHKRLQSYVHFGTGNYHPVTAKIYTDLSFFTCDSELGQDTLQLFNYMTGYAKPSAIKQLGIAPLTLRQQLIGLIQTEMANAKAGKPAAIWAKMNALVDPVIIDALYEASQAGVSIDLIVRGVCCLRPEVPMLSDNIRVKSLIGRFLEHTRIVCFANGRELPSPEAKVFISSADWMGRNFDGRVESLVPITNPTVHEQILSQIMIANLKDTENSWQLAGDGTYHKAEAPENPFCAHTFFMTNPSLSGRGKSLLSAKRPPRLVIRKTKD